MNFYMMWPMETAATSAGNWSWRKRLFSSRKSAFSLIELLVVIAVIAIIAAIAIPAFTNILGETGESKNRRNAQQLATLASAIVSAGHAGTNTLNGWVDLLTNGVSVSNSFGETIGYFRADALNSNDISGLSTYLYVTNSQLVYQPDATP